MTSHELTCRTPAATTAAMNRIDQNIGGGVLHKLTGERRGGWRSVCAGLLLTEGAMMLSGCISVAAPDKPIVIELNINIKQEVIYRLAADAAKTIDSNKDIF